MEKMKKILEKFKKAVAPFLVGIAASLLTVGLLYLAIGSDDVRNMTEAGTDNISYVLVNEDLGFTFNGVDYNFGVEFLTVINQDRTNRWQTASRSVAEAGLNSGTFDVMIVLPQNFTAALLSIESTNPIQAQITYDVRLGHNELANMVVREEVNTILTDFSDRIVQMYFSSILGSLFDAQLNVGAMIDDEQGRHALFVDGVRQPFYNLPSVFSGVVNNTLFLETQTDNWQNQHTDFATMVGEVLITANENITANNATINEFIQLTRVINDQNLRNADFALNQQSTLDQEFYHDQFTNLNDSVSDQLDSLEGIVGDFMNVADEFSTNQESVQSTLTEQVSALEEQNGNLATEISELQSIQTEIATWFFGDANASPDSPNMENVRQMIINLFPVPVPPTDCEEDDYDCDHYQNGDYDIYALSETDDEYDDEYDNGENGQPTGFTVEEIADIIAPFLINQGTQLFNDINVRQDELTTIQDAISDAQIQVGDALETLDDPSKMAEQGDMIQGGVNDAQTTLATTFGSWEIADVLEITTRHHHANSSRNHEPSVTFYYDYQAGNQLTITTSNTATTMQNSLDFITQRDVQMTDLGGSFASIIAQTNDVHGMTENITTDMTRLSGLTDAGVATSQNFMQNFAQVMPNARIGGADNQNVLNFLSSPINLIGNYESYGEVSFVPYQLTIISMMLIFAVGYGLRYFYQQRKLTTTDEIVGRSLIWKNAPFTLKAVIISLTIGLIFSNFSMRSIPTTNPTAWLIFTTLLITIGTLLVAYLARQLPKTTLFIFGGIIALYLLLNPVLGIQIEPGTFAETLFNFSPLQLIEQIFTQLTTDATISIINFVLVFLLAIIAIVINLFVIVPKQKLNAGGELNE